MADQAQYRFLPWTRRGLVAEVQDADPGGALPGRAKISVGVTVTNALTKAVNLALYGPGDVLGIDARLLRSVTGVPTSYTDVFTVRSTGRRTFMYIDASCVIYVA